MTKKKLLMNLMFMLNKDSVSEVYNYIVSYYNYENMTKGLLERLVDSLAFVRSCKAYKVA